MKIGVIGWVIIAVVVLGIIGLIAYLVLKNKSENEVVIPPPPVPGEPCVPYTEEQQKRDVQALRGKCAKYSQVPLVGIGLNYQCLQKGKAALPPIKRCF